MEIGERRVLWHQQCANASLSSPLFVSLYHERRPAKTWQGTILAESVMGYKIPTLGIPEGLNHVPVAIAGALIVLFSIEHIIALVKGEEVIPSWH